MILARTYAPAIQIGASGQKYQFMPGMIAVDVDAADAPALVEKGMLRTVQPQELGTLNGYTARRQ